jgi:Putative lumazine-binding
MSNEIPAIEKVIQTYFDGLYEGDTKKLGAAFHEVSHLYSAGPEGVQDLPRAKWFEAVQTRPSGKARNLPRRDRIVSIDMSGPETAFVKVECQLPPRYFTDYLLLLKGAEGWKIVSKSFRADVRE